MEGNDLCWIVLLGVIVFNINDLIRGWWFYGGWGSVFVWNAFALAGAYLIYSDYKKRN